MEGCELENGGDEGLLDRRCWGRTIGRASIGFMAGEWMLNRKLMHVVGVFT